MPVWGAEGRWEISVPSSPFCCESKTALNVQSFSKKKKLAGFSLLMQEHGLCLKPEVAGRSRSITLVMKPPVTIPLTQT